jgi:hypothetical protein
MAINPSLITTARVGELPPLPLQLDSKIAHEVNDILYRSSIEELVNFIRAASISQPYEKKDIIAPNPAYITDNFDMTPGATEGLGIVGGLWEGWAICNGNNGTPNLDGQTLIGYGANYGTVGQFVGSADAILVEHSHTIEYTSRNASGSGSERVLYNGTVGVNGTNTSGLAGEDGTGKNIQPSMVILMIMKLP